MKKIVLTVAAAGLISAASAMPAAASCEMQTRYGDELIHLPGGEIRRPNLEDLFLDLTGHSLRS